VGLRINLVALAQTSGSSLAQDQTVGV